MNIFAEIRKKAREEAIQKFLNSSKEDLIKMIDELKLEDPISQEEKEEVLKCAVNFQSVDLQKQFNETKYYFLMPIPENELEYHPKENCWGCFDSKKYKRFIRAFQELLGDFGDLNTAQRSFLEKTVDQKDLLDLNGKRLPKDHWILLIKSARGRPSIMDFNPGCGNCNRECANENH